MLWYTVLYVVHVVYCGNQHWTPAGHAEGLGNWGPNRDSYRDPNNHIYLV